MTGQTDQLGGYTKHQPKFKFLTPKQEFLDFTTNKPTPHSKVLVITVRAIN